MRSMMTMFMDLDDYDEEEEEEEEGGLTGGVRSLRKTKSKLGKTASQATVSLTTLPQSLYTVQVNKKHVHFVSPGLLKYTVDTFYDAFLKTQFSYFNKINEQSDSVSKYVASVVPKIQNTSMLIHSMDKLEAVLADYVEKINDLDMFISANMTDFQENITEMQQDLETGIENMNEAISHQTGDVERIAELHQNFSFLFTDFERFAELQADFLRKGKEIKINAQEIKKKVDHVGEIKANRRDVAEQMNTKAGILLLNGLISKSQFDAVRGDFENQVKFTYDKYNSQELMWQKSLEDILRDLNEKASMMQIESLIVEIKKLLDMLNERVDFLLDLTGIPARYEPDRMLFRDRNCLSCSLPAPLRALAEEDTFLDLKTIAKGTITEPRKEATDGGTLSSRDQEEDIEIELCYPGYPCPRSPRSPRSVCQVEKRKDECLIGVAAQDLATVIRMDPPARPPPSVTSSKVRKRPYRAWRVKRQPGEGEDEEDEAPPPPPPPPEQPIVEPVRVEQAVEEGEEEAEGED